MKKSRLGAPDWVCWTLRSLFFLLEQAASLNPTSSKLAFIVLFSFAATGSELDV